LHYVVKNPHSWQEKQTFVLYAPMDANRESNYVKTVTADDLLQQRISGFLINVNQKISIGPDTLLYAVSRTVMLSIDIATNFQATTAADVVTSHGDTINNDKTINKTRAALTY